MSGPHADQQAPLSPDQIVSLVDIYRAHMPQIGEPCRCGEDGCRLGAEARAQLWAHGINTEGYKP